MNKYIRWTPEESQILKDHYYSRGGAELARTLLPHRTSLQISSRAAYMGLSFNSELIGDHARNKEDLGHLIGVQSPFAAYMLGFLWADGTVNKRTYNIQLKIVDSDFVDIREQWLATAKWRYSIHEDGNPNHKPQAHVCLNHKEFHAFLVQRGYLFKTGDSASDVLAVVPDIYNHYWWRGYFDGDGGFTASGKTRRVSITSCIEQNWDFFNILATKIGFAYHISRSTCKGSSHSSVIINDEANLRRFMDYLYQGEQFGLSRKKQAYLDYIEYKQAIRLNKTSVYRGVFWNSEKHKWMMAIYCGKQIREYHTSELDAARSYDDKAKVLFGNKAVLNFPNV